MTDQLSEKLKYPHLAIAVLSALCLLFLFLLWSESSQAADYQSKIAKEEKKLHEVRSLVANNWGLLFGSGKGNSSAPGTQLNTAQLTKLVENTVKELSMDKWLVRIQPVKSRRSDRRGAVRLVFRDFPLQAMINFFQALHKKNRFLKEKQVSIVLAGKNEDKWRAVVSLSWEGEED